MTIKTYPLYFTEDKLDAIRQAAARDEKTIKQFILDAIDKELNREREAGAAVSKSK